MTISTETRLKRIENYINNNDLPISVGSMTDGIPAFIIQDPQNDKANRFYRLLNDSRIFNSNDVVVGYYEDHVSTADWMPTELKLVEYGPMFPDYYQGSTGATIVVPVDNTTTLKELVELIEDEINQIWDHIEYTFPDNPRLENDINQLIDDLYTQIAGRGQELYCPDIEDQGDDEEIIYAFFSIEKD